MNRTKDKDIDAINDWLASGERLSLFLLKAAPNREIERLACMGTAPIVEQCFFLYIKKLVEEFEPTKEYHGIHLDYRVERYDLPKQRFSPYEGDERRYFRERVYPQILHYDLKPVNTIILREAQFNLAMKPATYSMAELRDRYIYLYKYMRDSATAINPAEIDRLCNLYASTSDRFLVPGTNRMKRVVHTSSPREKSDINPNIASKPDESERAAKSKSLKIK